MTAYRKRCFVMFLLLALLVFIGGFLLVAYVHPQSAPRSEKHVHLQAVSLPKVYSSRFCDLAPHPNICFVSWDDVLIADREKAFDNDLIVTHHSQGMSCIAALNAARRMQKAHPGRSVWTECGPGAKKEK